ncbi:serine hydrolase [Aureitalea marina]|uniref:Serine hydrolase n=1 Tax=Aureitalea marina TaxID=930804 RepID=A0A2S7KQ65_9FLAO|nr:serine hydrolase [Aureitalea marina]PQB04766.1 serine hydrolase [Aureitalea marina]
MSKLNHFLLLFALMLTQLIWGQSLDQKIDAILSEQYPADGPGVSALVAKDGQVIYTAAFGLANLEHQIPLKPESVFEIGSITKQFTAVAILMLEQAGKLKVSDNITKYIPDYPTQGKTITLQHLLNHTSGIKSYTNMPSFMSEARTDMTPNELIDVFKNETVEFDPGTQWNYNNSGYIILGEIIERVSGMSYEAFVETKLFAPAGMKNSRYGSHSEIILNRANGYQPVEGGFRNADYLSMTLPYAAGSLMSTVGDLYKWQQALSGNKLISASQLKKAWTNTALNDGSLTNYGYGWSINEISDVPSIEHGGGIFGYTTYAIHIPEEDLYVAVFANSNGNSPTDVTIRIAAEAIGKPYQTKGFVQLNQEQLNRWVGTYQYKNDVIRDITLEDGQLYSQRRGSSKLPIMAISENEFIFEGSTTRYQFRMEEGKKKVTFINRIDKAEGVEANIPKKKEKVAIDIDPALLKNYIGTYQMQPGMNLEVSQEGDQLMAQITGQPTFPIFPEKEHTFFLKVVEANLVFDVGNDGQADAVTLNQGGQQMTAKRLD